jgi:ubiquinone biosynthesis protein
MAIAAYFRLLRAGFVLAREGALSLVDPGLLPGWSRPLVAIGRVVERGAVRRTGRAERLSRALNRLGPTYVKFGQSLSTRPDIVGVQLAADLSALQDRMEPFDPALVPGLLAEALGDKAAALTEISPPIAAASIAQVHRAMLRPVGGAPRIVAVKILRPGVRRRFAADLESFLAAATLGEALIPALRRLKPVEVVRTLERSARLELDLRLEAASIAEMTGNIAKDEGFAVPEVIWDQTSDSVLTTQFIDGIALSDTAGLDAAGFDRKALAITLLQSFLKHAIRDGFFHADMHPGNLFAERATGGLVAVDFGIMGRLSPAERRFLADILYGFITRDYQRIAERHFEIGYVPADQSVADFTLALRAIGEPLHGRTVRDISMAKVLGQLFAVTEMFAMQTRPELVLLQKNMVLVEGVSRLLDPDLDLFTAAEPFVGAWVRRQVGPLGRIEELAEDFGAGYAALKRLPGLVEKADALFDQYQADRAERMAAYRRSRTAVLWLGGMAIVLVAVIWALS